jgi:cell division protein FtsL
MKMIIDLFNQYPFFVLLAGALFFISLVLCIAVFIRMVYFYIKAYFTRAKVVKMAPKAQAKNKYKAAA